MTIGQPPRRTQVAVLPAPLGRLRFRKPPPEPGRPIQHLLLAGPVAGLLSALYNYHLSLIGAAQPNAATHQTIRQISSWHGHLLRAYFITPAQNRLAWFLGMAALLWTVAVVVGVVILGVRSHQAKRQ